MDVCASTPWDSFADYLLEANATLRQLKLSLPSYEPVLMGMYVPYLQRCLPFPGWLASALLGEDAGALSPDERLAALQALSMSLEDAAATLHKAGVCLRTAFIDFAEMCMAHRLRLLVHARPDLFCERLHQALARSVVRRGGKLVRKPVEALLLQVASLNAQATQRVEH